MIDVVALGELLIDFTASADPFGRQQTYIANPGGAPSNFLSAFSQYGGHAAFIGKVGDDHFGHMLKGCLDERNIDTRGLRLDPSVFTTLAFVSLSPDGDRSFSFSRKPGADTQLRSEEIDFTLIDSARVFHFGSLSLTDEPARSATRDAVVFAKAKNKLISFDPNLRKPLWESEADACEQILYGLSVADIVKISEDELKFLFGCDAETGARILLDTYSVRLAMVTMGAEGCLLMTSRESCRMYPPKVKPIDTTGAGDIFGGSAMRQILVSNTVPDQLTREQLERIARFSLTAASLSTEHLGGIASIPSLRVVLDRIGEAQTC